MKIKIKKLSADAVTPKRSKPGSNGYDVYATSEHTLWPGDRVAVSTGIQAELPEGYAALVCPRSGHAFNDGVTVVNAPGVIDADFRGEWKIGLINHGEGIFNVAPGNKVAQVLIVKTEDVEFIETDEKLSQTQRGIDGFGSTGK